MPHGNELLTSPQVGAILGKSVRTVHRMVDSGALKPVQQLPGPNGAYLFRRRDVEALASKQRPVVGAA